MLFVFNYINLRCCILLLNYPIEIMLLKLFCLIYIVVVEFHLHYVWQREVLKKRERSEREYEKREICKK